MIIRNGTKRDVDLRGWRLRDRSGNQYPLAGAIAAGQAATITMTEATMPLNNDGDEEVLVDDTGVGRSRVAYTAEQVRSGAAIRFVK